MRIESLEASIQTVFGVCCRSFPKRLTSHCDLELSVHILSMHDR